LLVELPLVVIGLLVWTSIRNPGFDFEIFRHAGAAVLHGRTPYVQPSLAELARQDHFVYPQPIAYAFVPFALVPAAVGAGLFLFVSLGCLIAALRLFGITDWRLYGLPLLTVPVFDAAGLGTVNFLLLLLVAAGWRLRGSAWAGVVLAIAAATKLFLWPLLLWLVVTRRFRACFAATATLVLLLGVWAAVDPTGLRRYPTTLRLLEQGHPSSYSLRALWIATGLPASMLVPVVVGAAGCAILVLLRERDRDAFVAAVVVALLATPIMWLHYLVMLLVPLSLLRPRFAWPWLLPLVLWATPTSSPHFTTWRIVLVLVVVLAVPAAACSGALRSTAGLIRRTGVTRPV